MCILLQETRTTVGGFRMPCYHSQFNDVKGYPSACGLAILPLKTSVKGPAPKGKSDQEDIVDEVLRYYRANVLFSNFDINGGADRVLIVMTLYISQCLKRLEKCPNKDAATKTMFELAKENFPLPGDGGWQLGGHIPKAKDRKEADAARGYLKQLREEAGNRLIEKIYGDDGKPNKFWMAFSKRKFMNIMIS